MLSKECTRNRQGLVTGQKFLPAHVKFVYEIQNSTTRFQKCYKKEGEKIVFSQEESLYFEPVMFNDVKGFSFSPMHMTMR